MDIPKGQPKWNDTPSPVVGQFEIRFCSIVVAIFNTFSFVHSWLLATLQFVKWQVFQFRKD